MKKETWITIYVCAIVFVLFVSLLTALEIGKGMEKCETNWIIYQEILSDNIPNIDLGDKLECYFNNYNLTDINKDKYYCLIYKTEEVCVEVKR